MNFKYIMSPIKIITIGEAGVGKTALTMRYANDVFGLHGMTIGVDFATKSLPDGHKLQIWDTAGQESFRSISRSYYRGAHGALLVFALDNYSSFSKIHEWYTDFKNSNSQGLCVVVGTKNELYHTVQFDEIKQFCTLYDLPYFSCSAKKNINVDAPFSYLHENIKLSTQFCNEQQNVHIENQKVQKEYYCCQN